MNNVENTLEELLLMLNHLKAEHDFLHFLVDVIDKKDMEKYRQMYFAPYTHQKSYKESEE